ncbi:peptidase S8/S53 subtilisin kexin sedolisin [Fibrella aestuarina BUZ 2]|uniref:Peptidase S8/S53 subtilisin kexin sedolisin n=1 Tax=Fibrella aestuarina BUZ 2 TaxID=1166018 RepID=I0K2U1_9BACT|nr:S8 family serine peptidase [Fibrella aestuarina]CCG98444.1 peptidase S8/S53 subtilisin kexin sedolisin [Fibrella aestuarina BUZ 2]
MTQFYRLAGLLAFLSSSVLAQPLPQYSAAQRSRLQALQQTLSQEQTSNYQRALTVATQRGRQAIEPAGNGHVQILRGIDEITGNLLYDISFTNVRAAETTRTTSLYSGGSLGVNLRGGSASVKDRLGMWEIAATYTGHPEFQGRVVQQDITSSIDREADDVNHATHVGGTLVAAGLNPLVRGMASGANLKAWDASSDVSEMTGAGQNLLLSNHSYGSIAGWRYNSSRTTTNKWEWWGDTTLSATQDFKFGQYDNTARAWDVVAAAAPYYLITKSAGNNHAEGGPPAGEAYFLVQHSSRRSTTPRETQVGYDNIPTYGNAKNILTVGAVSRLSNGYNRPGDVSIASFSSWGPTDDGRIKPDIVGMGVNVTSTVSSASFAYGTESGTSMSSPNVSGSLLLLQEYFASLNASKVMRASTLKALVLHTADEAGDAPGPDYRFGWGLLNVEKAAQVIRNAERTHVLDERTLAQGATYSLSVVASGRGPLVATIAWTDPEGTAQTGAARINDRTPKLVNDLDLRLADGTTTTSPWVLDPENPASAATRGDNIRDNVEQVYVANPVPGRTYVLTISHKGTLRNNAQDYGLVISGAGGVAYCASAASSSGDSKIARVQFANVDQAGATGCTTYTDFTSATTVAEVQPSQPVPITVTTGTCGAARSVVVKTFADWNANGSFTDAGELLGTSTVLTGPGTFVGSLTAPASVTAGSIVRLRIVVVETADANAVQPCGNYGAGETQDYLLRIIRSQNDVAVTTLPSASPLCAGTETVSVRVRNLGGNDQANLPVTVTVTRDNQPVATFNSTITQLRAYRDTQLAFTLPTSVTLLPGQTYRFTTRIQLPSDQDTTNNSFTETRTVGASSLVGNFAAVTCTGDPALQLQNTGQGTAFWYDAAVGGTLLAAGNRTSIASRPTVYASLNDFAGRLGPVSKTDFQGGSYAGNFGPQPLISTNVPLRIDRARIYTGAAGRLTFSVRRFDETVISSVTLDVQATRTLPASATIAGGQQANDPNDQGAVYPLNLSIPEPGDYKIAIEYEEGVTIFRSNSATAGFSFPYQLRSQSGDVIASSKGSLFQQATGVMDTLRTAWYYFYDMQLRPLDCPSAQRVAVTPSVRPAPTVRASAIGSTSVCQGGAVTLLGTATTAVAGETFGYQWLRDGQPIAGATSLTYAASEAGSYSLQLISSCSPISSSAIAVTVRPAQQPTVAQSGNVLSSNALTGNQWLLAGVPIAGATSQTYVATQTGRYSVRANVGGCGEATSAETFVTILAVEPALSASLRVFPNPTANRLTVEIDAAASATTPTVRLLDVRGALQQQQLMAQQGSKYQVILELANLPAGMFFVQILHDPTKPLAVKAVLKQ